MRLSLCIATFDEENFIHYPLDSAFDFVDEVIIVDGGSSDKTVEIAKSYGNKVRLIETDNPPMFHINKQKAIEAAKGEWVLQLDADEALSEELKEEIRSVVADSSSRDPVAYWLPRRNFFLTRFLEKGGQYPDYTVRLYRNGVAHFPCKTVHEQVEIANAISKKKLIGYLKNPLLHYADPNFSRYLKRWQRYTTLDAQLLVQEGKKPSFFSYMIWKPLTWFLSTYLRHKGFMDGFPGFVFALFSSLRFWLIYVKAWSLQHKTSA